MEKKGLMIKILAFIFTMYMISVSVMMCYYWYKDVKTHDGFIRAVFWSPLVGVFRATHWPYYEFVADERTSRQEPPAVTALSRSISFLNSARTLMEGLPTSKNPKEDLQSIVNLLRNAQREAEGIDTNELNRLKPGFGDVVRDHYLVAVRYYNSVLIEGGDRNDVHRGDASMAMFYQWMEANKDR